MSYFEGKRFFLVGGSEGIGLQTAVALARAGAHVVTSARRTGPLEEAVAAMKAAARSSSQHLSYAAFDATDRAAVRQVVPEVVARLGGLDGVITNLGFARAGYVHELDDGVFDAMLQTNYLAHVNVIRACLPTFLAQKRGDICLVSSQLGFMSAPGWTAYSASKFAVAGFAEALRLEVSTSNVKVVLYYPGTTETPGLKSENETKPEAVWKMEEDSSFNKIYTAEEAALGLLRAIERGRFENFTGAQTWFIWWMYQHFPGLSRWMAGREWAAAVAKSRGSGTTGP